MSLIQWGMALRTAPRRRRARGQAILEYLLMVVMLAVTFAVVIRNSNRQIYRLWTALASQIARPCPDCEPAEPPPDF